jgi:hypothetical protein
MKNPTYYFVLLFLTGLFLIIGCASGITWVTILFLGLAMACAIITAVIYDNPRPR